MHKPYDHRNCQSLFGYAQMVHERCRGTCQLCGCSAVPADFDLWRQLTVEHLIGGSQGGYLGQIQQAVRQRFPDMPVSELEKLAAELDEANTVTACRFCNSMTSRVSNPKSMRELIAEAEGTPKAVRRAVLSELTTVLGKKRQMVQWKLDSVRKAFERDVKPKLAND